MKQKISKIRDQSGVPASTIRYYVREGLLPAPEKVNKKMAYYDEACIERLKVIQYLKDKRYFPLSLIKNILSRMDEGLSIQEAEAVENAVFGSGDPFGMKSVVDRKTLLAETGLTEDKLEIAENIDIMLPLAYEGGKTLYNEDDIRLGRDLKKVIDLGIDLNDLAFYAELGKKIIEKEMALRRKLVKDKSTKENIRITAEITLAVDFPREYITKRLFQKRVQEKIQKSLQKRKNTQPEKTKVTGRGGK